MTGTSLDRHRYVLGDPSAHVGFLNCERIAQRSHIHGWSVEAHYHEGLAQLFIFGNGDVKSQMDYATHRIAGPAIMWLPALCSHAFEYQVGMEGWVITVPTMDVARIAAKAPWCERWITMPQILTGSEQLARLSEAVAIARTLEREYREAGEDRNTALESWFRLLLILLNRGLSDVSRPQEELTGRKRRLVMQFQSLLEQREAVGQSVSTYAQLLSVTPTHLSRTVKAVTGRTAGEIVAAHSLLIAKRRLAFTDQSISELAYDLGFSSPSYFTRFFSGHMNETPRSFRKRIRSGEA